MLKESYYNQVMSDMWMNKAILLSRHLATMVEYVTNLDNIKLSSSALEGKIKLSSNLLARYCQTKIYDNWYETLKRSCVTIRTKNIIFSPKIRTNIVITALDALNKYITLSDSPKHIPILVKFVWALSFCLTDVGEDSPDKPTQDDLLKLIDILHLKGALPKGRAEIETELSAENEMCNRTFYKNLRDRIKRNSNNVIFIGGEHGTGKSYTALKIAYDLDKTFDIEKQLVYSNKDFVKVCNYLKDNGLFGKVVIYDEFGAGANSYNWHEEKNILLDEYLQKFRYLRLTVIFTARDVRDAISRARKRYTHLINMVDVQKCEIFKLKSYYDIEKDKLITEALNYEYEDDENRYILKYFNVPKIDDEIAEEYERIRDEKIGKHDLKRIEEELELLDSGMTVSQMVEDFIKNHANNDEAYNQKGDISVSYLMTVYNIGKTKANRLKMLIKQKMGIV